MNGMKQGRMQRTPSGPAYVSRLGVSLGLGACEHVKVLMQLARQLLASHALLEDSRVFHIADKNFVSMYNKQGEDLLHLSLLS